MSEIKLLQYINYRRAVNIKSRGDCMSKLTDKQEMFCKEYIIDLNATQAATRASYSAKTAGVIGLENLGKPLIQARLAELMKERSERVKIDADWVLRQAVKVHERCMQAEPVTDREGNATGEFKFEASGANKALELVGKHVNVQAFLDKSKVEHALTDDFETLLGNASE
jgi:phage terminase small subunit